VNEEARRRNGNLPGMGGIFNTVNLHVYHYAGNNPLKYTDPDGREDEENPLLKGFKTQEEAAINVLMIINILSKEENVEYGGLIFQDATDGLYYASPPITAEKGDQVNPYESPIRVGGTIVGDYHTHADYSIKGPDGQIVKTGDPNMDHYNSDTFSLEDKIAAMKAVIILNRAHGTDTSKYDQRYRSYLATPSNSIKEFNPFGIGGPESRLKTLVTRF
jgi:hypothetical protein